MKHLAAVALIAASLAACQTTAPRLQAVDLATPAMPADMRPIAGTITLGSEPVAGAMLTESRRIVIRQGGQSGLLTIESRAIADTSRDGRLSSLRVAVLNVEMQSAGVSGDEADRLRSLFETTGGDVTEYRMDVPSGRATITLERNGEKTIHSSEVEYGFLTLLRLPNFGGQTVAQGGELAGYRFGDVFPTIAPELAHLAYSARAVGETTHNGRPAIVAEISGAILLDDTPLQIAGLIYIDRQTGAALYSETRLGSMVAERQAKEITLTQSLALR